MSTTKNKYGGLVEHFTHFIVMPATSIDTEIDAPSFRYPELDANGEPTGVTLNYSLRGHEQANSSRKIMYSTDNEYVYYGVVMSNLKNEDKDFKAFMKTAGLVLGGEDYTVMVGDELWLLVAPELDEWLVTSPHNVPIEEIV